MRDWFADDVWQIAKAKIRAVSDSRDLGAHICVTTEMHASTLHERMDNAIVSANNVDKQPLTMFNKAKTVSTHNLPLALPGCEVASACLNHVKIGTIILSMIHTCDAKRSRDLRFQFCSRGSDTDLEANITLRRTNALRRAVDKDPLVSGRVKRLMIYYTRIGMNGTANSKVGAITEANQAPGPIALITQDVHNMGAILDDKTI